MTAPITSVDEPWRDPAPGSDKPGGRLLLDTTSRQPADHLDFANLTLLLQKFCLCSAETSSCTLICSQINTYGRNSSFVQS